MVLISWFIKLIVQTLQPLIVIYKRVNFVCVIIGDVHKFSGHRFIPEYSLNILYKLLLRWVEYGKRYRACCCAQNISAVDGQRLSLHPFISKYQPDRSLTCCGSWKENGVAGITLAFSYF